MAVGRLSKKAVIWVLIGIASSQTGGCRDRDEALLAEVRRGDAKACRRLIAEGADPNYIDGEGHTALWYAVAGGNRALARALIEAGGEVDVPGQVESPLVAAVVDGDAEMLAVLLEGGGIRNDTIEEAAVWAAGLFRAEALAAMAERGFSVSSPAVLRVSILTPSEESNKVEATITVIVRGMYVNENMGRGNTPLHLAAREGNVPAVKVLLGEGANPSLQNDDGDTPVDVAQRYGNSAVARLLKEFWDRRRGGFN